MKKMNQDYVAIAQSGLFSADWYLYQYRDVAAAGRDPLEHYLSYGANEGRDPGPEFSTSGYLSRYTDVASAGINPLLHYIRYGKNEGRLAKHCLDPQTIKRPYGDFDEYLIHSMLDPLVKAPFALVDLDSFKLMEQTAKWLCSKQKEQSETPLVSVIMPMRDRANTIGDAVRSVLEQSYTNFELIVIDDGSQDDSVSVVLAFSDTRIRFLASAISAGVSAARNRGLEIAQGEFIAYLDSDNTWQPDYLSAMVGAFQLRSDADAAYSGQYLYLGDSGEPFAVRFGSYNPSLLRNHNYIDLNCFIHRKDILQIIDGGFCEEIRRWVDWELILRIAHVGRIYSIPILQSNYYMEKAKNTITVTEKLEPARQYIMKKTGYEGRSDTLDCEGQLTKNISIIIVVPGDRESIEGCIEALPKQLNDPLVQVIIAVKVSNPGITEYLQELEKFGANAIVVASDCDLLNATGQAMQIAVPDSDLLVLDKTAQLTPGALPTLQRLAYSSDSIAITVPQGVLPKGDPTINTHVPYAFDDVPCDVALSQRYWNVESLPLFHDGRVIDLNFTSLVGAYIKRDTWNLYSQFQIQAVNDHQSDRILCNFVRHVLEKRIVYTPGAIVLHRKVL